MYSIEIDNISKVYSPRLKSKSVHALSEFSLNINSGTFFGLLGPNGAGKTTLVKILLGITKLSSGNARILGESIENYKNRMNIGYLPENHRLPLYLSGESTLKYFGKFYFRDSKALKRKIDEVLDLVNMTKWRKHKLKTYSKGMMQRLGLAQAMIHDPKILFLDEPTDGVDPIGRKQIREILINLKNEGKTIFLNSHLLQEVELVADNIVILDKGKIIRQGTLDELNRNNMEYRIDFEGTFEIKELNQELQDSIKQNDSTSKLILQTDSLDKLNGLIDSMRNKHCLIKSVEPIKDSLEDIFVSLINNNSKGAKK